MQLSHRIRGINPDASNSWEVFDRAREMKLAGESVVELTIGEHDTATDAAILTHLHQSAVDGHTGYSAMSGTDALRQAVAARVEARTGVPTSAANVLITSGGQGALFAAHMLACDPGDSAAFIDPYYATYPGTIRSVGAVPRPVMARAEHNFEPSYAALSTSTRGARSLLVNSPNNPTGVVYSIEALNNIARACQENDLWLISDEVYDTQVWHGTHISPRTLPGMEERTLVIGSMSKSHAMTGSRIGWVVGPEAAISHMAELAINTTYGVPGYIQDAALFALQQGRRFEEDIAAPFQRRQALIQPLIAAQDVVRAVPSMGAMYQMLDIRATGMSGIDFALRLLKEEKIATMPGESFGQAAAGHLRVALTVDDDTLTGALGRMLAFARARALQAAG